MKNPPAFLNLKSPLPDGDFSIADLDIEVQRHIKVLRIKDNEEMILLDGRGAVQRAQCTDGRNFKFKTLSTAHKEKSSPYIHLCLSPPRGEALVTTLTQATEMGVQEMSFVRSEHNQHLKKQSLPMGRLQRVTDAAIEQCLSPWRLKMNPEWQSLESLLATKDEKVFADEGLSSQNILGFAREKPNAKGPIRLFIGPEGGWSESERQVFDSKAHALGLGNLILRVPTATVAAIQILKSLKNE